MMQKRLLDLAAPGGRGAKAGYQNLGQTIEATRILSKARTLVEQGLKYKRQAKIIHDAAQQINAARPAYAQAEQARVATLLSIKVLVERPGSTQPPWQHLLCFPPTRHPSEAGIGQATSFGCAQRGKGWVLHPELLRAFSMAADRQQAMAAALFESVETDVSSVCF
ncbi:hypothetical protein AK812_SmicGene41064 [Symbiodinium microadriaticum]|uniref:Uncharacterized protein n=1 Tax=Symbiodinium microadriaticum TaxID=2951 RepID=A0A1Q9C741_SYMMI|nr:hypothetical protein AK812_SmicGene41064 [Symbiodinium microadriaticum]